MELNEIKELLKTTEYGFLENHPNLGNNIALIGLGGSHAYGTNREDSDVDIRGVATNSSNYILTGRDFEQVVDVPTDTTIYSVDKLFKLLCQCNPNTIELLGLKPDHYLYKNKIGEMILDNKHLFLSKVAIHSFGGYANDQLRRMENKSNAVSTPLKKEEGIVKSIQNAMYTIASKHALMPDDALSIYVDGDDNNADIFMDVTLTHYPLRDYCGVYAELNQIVKEYKKGNNHRNTNAITHNKLGKHMMHLVRLYLMCFDILEKGEISTYREHDLPLLNGIRNGDYINEDRQPTPEFYDLLGDLEKRFNYAKINTSLPDRVDTNKVFDLLSEINLMIVKGDV